MRGVITIGGSLLLGAIIVSTAFLMRDNDASGAGNIGAIAVANADGIRTHIGTTDSDGDGRSDWQEELEGTDPLTPDEAPIRERGGTDIDALLEKGLNATSSEPKTFTEAFARSYIEELIRSKNSSSGISKETLVNQAVGSVEGAVLARVYSPSDLTIINNATESDVRTYGNELGAVLEQPVLPGGADPFAIMLKAMQDEDPEMASRLSAYRIGYKTIRDGVQSVPVPNTLVKEHLRLLNVFSSIHDSFAYLETRMFDDPLLAFGYYVKLVEKLEEMHVAVADIADALAEQNIYYTKEESGTMIFEFSL